jgi:hypothetical protein
MNPSASQSIDFITNMKAIEQELLITLYGLDNLRRTLPLQEWKSFCETQTTQQPLHKLLLNDPYTRRAFEKPKGYAGDAVLLDYLYGYNNPPDSEANPIGEKVFSFTTNSDPGEAIRYRRKFTAQLIDDIALQATSHSSVLSIAGGHVREADLSQAIQTKKVKRLVAYDQDKENLDVVKNQYAHLGIVPVQGTLNDLITNQYHFGNFDLIYAAGLFEYLNRFEAMQLIQWMFEALYEGGHLLVSNFREEVPNTLHRTYMEAFMQWFMEYRTDVAIIDLFSGLNPDQIEKFTFSTDPLCNIAFALVKKR